MTGTGTGGISNEEGPKGLLLFAGCRSEVVGLSEVELAAATAGEGSAGG